MAKVVYWTPEAEVSFEAILNYLTENWTYREVEQFVMATDRIVKLIIERPKLFRETNVRNVHEALVTSHNLLIYRISGKRIDLLVFWDTRQHPRKKVFKSI